MILDKAGIRNIVGKIHKDNVGKGKQNSTELMRTYLRELSPKLYNQLAGIYKIDFDMFGYEIPNYSDL
jgi:hypothetical protein